MTVRLRRRGAVAIGEDEEIGLVAAATQSYALTREVHLVFAPTRLQYREQHPVSVVLCTLDML